MVEENLLKKEIKDQNTALNVIISYLNLANKRGSFSLEESGKIWEAIKYFYTPNEENNN
jgi:hypothetical protein|tara:strand:- start:541 stop:717 length:177 start_codon:yes stop_codon:yes gene_type:complete